MLLVALEPAAPRTRIEAALILLGHRAEDVDAAAELGLITSTAERLEVVDSRLGRLAVHQAADRERRLAHLALAYARGRRMDGYDGRSAFERCALRSTAKLCGLKAPAPTEPPQGDSSRLESATSLSLQRRAFRREKSLLRHT